MRRACLLAVALAAVAPVPQARAQSPSVAVVLDGVQRQVPLVERQGRRFVALEAIATLLGGTVTQAGAEQAVLVIDESRLVVRRRIPFVEVGDRWYQLTDGAQKDAAGFYLPASSLDLLFPALWPGRFHGTAPGTVPPDVRPRPDQEPSPERRRSGMIGRAAGGGVDFWIAPGRTRLTFHSAATPGVEVDATAARTLRFRLAGIELAPALGEGLTRLGLVDSARVAPEGGATDVTLWLARAATVFSVAPLRSDEFRGTPAGVEVVLIDAPADAAAALLAGDVQLASARPDRGSAARSAGPAVREPSTRDAPAPGARPRPAEPPPDVARADAPSSGRRRNDWVVVVDAGHGGHDPGSLGPDGSREKDVTLAVSLALKEALAKEGIRVILTREDDTFVPLGGRTRLANDSRADVFVSIHANSAVRASAEGFETYFLSAAVTEDAKRVALMENSAISYENPAIDPASLDDVNFILWDLAQNEYLRESSALAEAVQVELGRRLPLKSRGVKQAPFYVLKGAFMPAILFETAFLSNPREEELLNDTAFRNRLADGLATSLVAYLDRYGRRVGVPATAAR